MHVFGLASKSIDDKSTVINTTTLLNIVIKAVYFKCRLNYSCYNYNMKKLPLIPMVFLRLIWNFYIWQVNLFLYYYEVHNRLLLHCLFADNIRFSYLYSDPNSIWRLTKKSMNSLKAAKPLLEYFHQFIPSNNLLLNNNSSEISSTNQSIIDSVSKINPLLIN